MGIRVHFTTADNLLMSVFGPNDIVPDIYVDEDDPLTTLRLVIEDDGNCEAMVIDGNLDALIRLADDIVERVNAAARR